jgi:hypothetical protein
MYSCRAVRALARTALAGCRFAWPETMEETFGEVIENLTEPVADAINLSTGRGRNGAVGGGTDANPMHNPIAWAQ